MVDWDQWRTLLAIFRQGTFAGAAKSLRVDATTVGRRLSLLEKHLGYDLFLRQNDRLRPTRRCEALLGHIETAAKALRDAEEESALAEQGEVWRELRLTAPPFLINCLLAPALAALVARHRIRVDLIGTASKVGLPRREVDIALRLDDGPKQVNSDPARLDAEEIGVISYAVYGPSAADPDSLPWAGLIEQYVRSSGGEIMAKLAGPEGFRFQVYHFEALREVVAAGQARALLPRLMGDKDARLTRHGGTALEQALWMLSHCQDRDVLHLKAARAWIRQCVSGRPR